MGMLSNANDSNANNSHTLAKLKTVTSKVHGHSKGAGKPGQSYSVLIHVCDEAKKKT